MFKENKEGKTHYENDGCGELAHNKPHSNNWEFDEEAHSKGRCSLSSMALCSAMEHKVKLHISETLVSERASMIGEIEKMKYGGFIPECHCGCCGGDCPQHTRDEEEKKKDEIFDQVINYLKNK